MHPADLPWKPLSLADTAKLFASFPSTWWVAGGHAIELAVQRSIRTHGDIDVGIWRDSVDTLYTFFSSKTETWELWAVNPPGRLQRWDRQSGARADVNDVWCKRAGEPYWRLQVMIAELDHQNLASRTAGKKYIGPSAIDRTGKLPYLLPHVQLYFKAKQPREKDELDLNAVLTSEAQINRAWLYDAITASYGPTHPWLSLL